MHIKHQLLILSLFLLAILFSCKKEMPNEQYNCLKVGYHFDDFSNGLANQFGPLRYGYNTHDNPNDGSPTNLKLVTGKFGKAVSFEEESSSMYIQYGLREFTNQFMIDFWLKVRTQASPEYRNIVGSPQGGNSFMIGLKDEYLSFSFMDIFDEEAPTLRSTQKLDSNIWYHVAVKYDGTSVKLFLNGKIDTLTSILMGQMDIWNATYIGLCDSQSFYEPGFFGVVDELRIWDFKFSDAEVKSYLMTTHVFD